MLKIIFHECLKKVYLHQIKLYTISLMQFLYNDKSKYTNTKRILRQYNVEWKKYAGRNYIGDCSKLFQRLNPESYTDFYKKYIEDGEKHKNNDELLIYRGRTEEEITNIAKMYQKDCNRFDIPLETFILNIICHVIHETYDGQNVEREVGKMLNKLNYIYKKPDGNEDAKYGIDFKVYSKDKLMFILQIKPMSFFTGNSNKSLIEDRINAFHKERLCNDMFGCKVYYMAYQINNNGGIYWYQDKNNKKCQLLSHFCNEDGTIKNYLI